MLHVGYIFHSFAHSCSGGGKLHSVGTDILLQAEGSKAAKMRRQHLSPPIDTGESVMCLNFLGQGRDTWLEQSMIPTASSLVTEQSALLPTAAL